MAAEILIVDAGDPDSAALARAGALLREGRLVAFPTETVYGLGANALDAGAAARIFAAKGRPANDPLIVHVAAVEAVAQVAGELPPTARLLAAAFWPGPLTLVLPRAAAVPLLVTSGLDTVAVRVPAHPVALGLLTAAGVPVAAPSANRFSRPSPTTADHVAADLGHAIDLILDAGPTPIGVESTIVDATGDGPPVLLRPGGVPLEALRQVVGEVRLRAQQPGRADDDPQPAPGLLTKHYAPRAALRLIVGPRATARARLAAELAACLAQGRRVGALLVEEDADLVTGLPVMTAWLGSEARPEEAARRLFAALRSLDATGVDVIAARAPGVGGLGLAILDRLTRAASGEVIVAE